MVLSTHVNVKGMSKKDENALQMGCLAHWPPSAFAQLGLFATTVGRLAH